MLLNAYARTVYEVGGLSEQVGKPSTNSGNSRGKKYQSLIHCSALRNVKNLHEEVETTSMIGCSETNRTVYDCQDNASAFEVMNTNVSTFQIVECSPRMNNYPGHVAPLAYFESATPRSILLTPCYADAQPSFNIAPGSVQSFPQGSCQGMQYILPYSVSSFGNTVPPLVPVVLPNSHSLPVLDYFNGLAYYAQIPCIAGFPGEPEVGYNLYNSYSSQEKQLHNHRSTPEILSSEDASPPAEESNMPKVWHQTFDELFKSFQDRWTLVPIPEGDPNSFKRILKDNAKVRFMCRDCRNAWTSMKGCIVFWVDLNTDTKCGEVYFRLFGQQCQKCQTKEFQFSMWYPEEVKKVLKNLYLRVGNLFYGFSKVEFDSCRRQGKPRSPHNASRCQACFNKVCTEVTQ